jgi:hypothetical protein
MKRKIKKILSLFLLVCLITPLYCNMNKSNAYAQEIIEKPYLEESSILPIYIDDTGKMYEKEGTPEKKTKTVKMNVGIFRPGMTIYVGVWNDELSKIHVFPSPHNGYYKAETVYVNPIMGDGRDFFNATFKPYYIKSADGDPVGKLFDINNVKLKTGATFESNATLIYNGTQLVAKYESGIKKENSVTANYWGKNNLGSITSKSAIPSNLFVNNYKIDRKENAITTDRETRLGGGSIPTEWNTSMPMNVNGTPWSKGSEENIDNWVVTGVYGDEWFDFGFNVDVPYYVQKYKLVSGGEPIPPSGGGEGTITFTPSQTPWTNVGKIAGFPVNVAVTGQNITHQWIQNYTLTQTTNTWSTVEPDKDGKGGSSQSDTTTNSSDISTPFDVKYTMGNITITGGSTPTTLPNAGGGILVPEGGNRNLNASATYIQQKGTPTPPTVPPSVNSGDGKNGSSTTYSLSTGGVEEVPPPNDPKGDAGTYNIDYTDPILELGAATNTWSRVVLNVPIDSFDPPGKYVASGQSGIQTSTYNVSDSSHYGRNANGNWVGSKDIQLNDGIYAISLDNEDIAGNTNDISDNTYYVDTTIPDCDFSVKVNQGVNNGTQRVFWGNGVSRVGEKLYGVLTTHDNLSGLINVSYAWTFGNSDSGASYKTIYTSAVTYYDRDNERPSFNIEKPVGDNMYLHVRMIDSAGNPSYYRFGAYEDPLKLKDFSVTDVKDPVWNKVFWRDEKLTQHTGVTYNASKLPIDDKNNTVYRNAYVKKGYAFYFNLTSEYLYRDADRIEIYPTFYYWDGSTRVPVDLYYNINNNPFIKVGSEKDTHTFSMKVNGSTIPIGGLKKLTLNDSVRLHKGQTFNAWKGTIQYTNGKEQWWYGKYYIPATSIFTKQGQTPRPENLLKKNYIIVNFNIVAYKNGIETNSYVSDNQKFFYNISNPVFPTVANQWGYEGGSKSPYLIGDTMIYDNSKSVLDDFTTIITQ